MFCSMDALLQSVIESWVAFPRKNERFTLYSRHWSAPGLTSGLQGSVNVHRGALLLVPQLQCISSFVFYISQQTCNCTTEFAKCSVRKYIVCDQGMKSKGNTDIQHWCFIFNFFFKSLNLIFLANVYNRRYHIPVYMYVMSEKLWLKTKTFVFVKVLRWENHSTSVWKYYLSPSIGVPGPSFGNTTLNEFDKFPVVPWVRIFAI